jgi:hypothetical protein
LVKTELAAKRLEEANKKFEQNRLLSEEARINKMLDGQAEAGQEPIKPSTQEKIKADIQGWFPKDLLPFSLR